MSRRARPAGRVPPPVLYAPWDRRLSADELPAVGPWAPDRDGVVLCYHSPGIHEGAPVVFQRIRIADVDSASLEMVAAAVVRDTEITTCTLYPRGTNLHHTGAAVAAANRLFHENPFPHINGPIITGAASTGAPDLSALHGYTRMIHDVQIVARNGSAESVEIWELRRVIYRSSDDLRAEIRP
ncbi:hypothetical protein FF36_06374 [Frankia torreyi]|uniref:Uncharacterized protein n=1 Tax=Frankia torreyi TaxID=1856 RepID=A0A0D8B5Z8_9ACTN|nr:hypothetical protein FF36_06374 [Frankia torreyi]